VPNQAAHTYISIASIQATTRNNHISPLYTIPIPRYCTVIKLSLPSSQLLYNEVIITVKDGGSARKKMATIDEVQRDVQSYKDGPRYCTVIKLSLSSSQLLYNEVIITVKDGGSARKKMATIDEVQRDVQSYKDEVNSLKKYFKNIEREQKELQEKLTKQVEEANNQWNNLMLWRKEDNTKSTQNDLVTNKILQRLDKIIATSLNFQSPPERTNPLDNSNSRSHNNKRIHDGTWFFNK
jgi:hypothetical protein